MMIYFDRGKFHAGDISFILPDKCYIDPNPSVIPNGFLLRSLDCDCFDLEVSVEYCEEDDYKSDFRKQIEECSRTAEFSDFSVNNLEGISAQYTSYDGRSFEAVFPVRCERIGYEDEEENVLDILLHVSPSNDFQTALNSPFTQQLLSSLQRENA